MAHFVVVYDRVTGKAVVQSFDGAASQEQALGARLEAELTAGPNEEVAALAAASIEDLQKTHARYFQGAVEMFGDLERLVAG